MSMQKLDHGGNLILFRGMCGGFQSHRSATLLIRIKVCVNGYKQIKKWKNKNS